MELFNFEQLMQLSAAALIVVALFVVYYINKGKDAAMTAILKLSIDTLTQAQEGQRHFYEAKVDGISKELAAERHERRDELEQERKERREEVAALKKRITELEGEVKERDQRIACLEGENAKLKREVERLKGAMSGKQDKEKAKKDGK